MRTIKFRRAFFFDAEKTQFSHFTEWGVDINSTVFTAPSTNNFALYYEDDQFTGLHDKNSKEIYERDIVKPCFRDENWFYRIISFEKGMFGYRDKTNSWCIIGIKQGNRPDNKQYEVIGNIYENPELLKI